METLIDNTNCLPFHRSGMATLSDLKKSEFRNVFSKLEKEQEIFLEKEAIFRSKEYKWPRDPLHDFSRVWEYPYVYYHLYEYLKRQPKNKRPIVADIGSGVTFFPFSLARIGYQVICADIDRICEKDLSLACGCVPHSPGKVEFILIEDNIVPLSDSECDAVYCISVLEHIQDFEMTIDEMARILKPNGLCLITCDINLRPEDGLQLDYVHYKRLLSSLERSFIRVFPEITIHPTDMLTTINSPYPRSGPSMGIFQTWWFIFKQRIIKPLIGRKPSNFKIGPPHVAVLGLVLRKRA